MNYMCTAHICREESKTQWTEAKKSFWEERTNCTWKDKNLLISYFFLFWSRLLLANHGMENWVAVGKSSLQTTRRKFQNYLDASKNNQFHIINSLGNWSLFFWIIPLSYFPSCVQTVLKNVLRYDDFFFKAHWDIGIFLITKCLNILYFTT